MSDGTASSHLHTTAWSMVIGAQQGGDAGRACLERLIRTYWKPAYYYARRRGMNHHDASDCVQEFFARMLDGDWLANVDQERGRFRGWLHTALRRWVSRRRTATGAERITLVSDEVVRAYEREAGNDDPDEAYHRAFAGACLDEALRLMEAEQTGARAVQVAAFRHYLERTAAAGRPPGYDELAAHFSVNVTTVTNWLHRMRGLFRTYLLRAVRETVDTPAAAEAELAELRRWLAG